MPMNYKLRIARPVSDLSRATKMYCEGLGLEMLSSFTDHEGFDGVMLGSPGASYHFEFTHCRAHPIIPTPTEEDMIVFYIPDKTEWSLTCERMITAGFEPVDSLNPYWDKQGRTFSDSDGYRIVLQRGCWG